MSQKVKNFLLSDKGDNFKNFVFGFQDGLISTYILLVGIAMLVRFNPAFLIFALIAEVAAGAISMTLGAIISTKTKNEAISKSIKINKDLGEKELQKEFQKLPFTEEELQQVLSIHEDNPKIFSKIFKNQELLNYEENILRNGALMGLAFILGGMLPVVPYFIPIPEWSFIIATISSFSALFIIGIFRSFYTEKHWIKPALEMIFIAISAIIIIEIYIYFIIVSYGMFLLAF